MVALLFFTWFVAFLISAWFISVYENKVNKIWKIVYGVCLTIGIVFFTIAIFSYIFNYHF